MATATKKRNLHKLPQVTDGAGYRLRLASTIGVTPDRTQEAVYTHDGLSLNRQEWCGCDEDTEVVYYEVYNVEGAEQAPELATREAHGYGCKKCRRIVQVG